MTWLDLIEKYGRPYDSEVYGVKVADDTVIQVSSLGKVLMFRKVNGKTEVTEIDKNRTPDQMDDIITALLED